MIMGGRDSKNNTSNDVVDRAFLMRIKSIEFKNFRNIDYGKLVFPNNDSECLENIKSSVLGIYGQNGSGKSSVIMALNMLKTILSHGSLGKQFNSCIQYGHDSCNLVYTFILVDYKANHGISGHNENEPINEIIYYSFDVKREQDALNNKDMLRIVNEKLSLSVATKEGKTILSKRVVIDTSDDKCKKNNIPFGTSRCFETILGRDKNMRAALMEAKNNAYEQSRSFVFSDEFWDLCMTRVSERFGLGLPEGIEQSNRELTDYLDSRNSDNESDDKENLKLDEIRLAKVTSDLVNYSIESVGLSKRYSPEFFLHYSLDDDKEHSKILKEVSMRKTIQFFAAHTVVRLVEYGECYMHIVDTQSTGRINLNQEMFLFHIFHEADSSFLNYATRICVNMQESFIVSDSLYKEIISSINSTNKVINSIIPGLSIVVDEKEREVNDKNENTVRLELMAKRGETVIPLRYESDGVRRIVSMISSMVTAYNESSFLLAVDEIDSGIYEYLLGELLSVLNESGKGQMVFTSHNLRPLEVLPAKNLCFTTTNPDSRFTTLSKRGNSNLRDTYFRGIVLGTDKDPLCYETSRYDIENAFTLAGLGDSND